MFSGLVGNNVQTQADVQCFQKELYFSSKEKSDRKVEMVSKSNQWLDLGILLWAQKVRKRGRWCVCKILTWIFLLLYFFYFLVFSGLVVFKRCVWTENLMFWTLQTLITQVTESYRGSDIQLTRILWCNPWLSVLCNLACWVFFFPHRTVLHIFQLVYWSIISSFKTVDVYTWPVSWGSNCKKKLHLKWNSVSERFLWSRNFADGASVS